MSYFRARRYARRTLAATLCILAATTLPTGPAAGAAGGVSALLYNYEFIGTHGTVVNAAPGGPAATLKLYGTWSPVPQGVRFSGDTTGQASVAYGRPQRGYTLDEPATAAVGFGARIVYERPAGGKCTSDTPNVTQIGRFDSPAQAKIQLSDCSVSQTKVMMECRFAGALTVPSTDPPVVSTLPLLGGSAYNVSCVKGPDDADGKTIITLSVTRIQTGQTVTNRFAVPALGAMATKSFLSAGNKYPLPAPALNTDQFNGIMARTIYCAGTLRAVRDCLMTYLPVS